MNFTTHTFNPATHKAVPKDAVVLTRHDLRHFGNRHETMLNYAAGLGSYHAAAEILRVIAEQMKPPRIAEPGLGSHVTAGKPDGTRSEFVRVGSRHWSEIGNGSGWEWFDLVDPTLVRAGVE